MEFSEKKFCKLFSTITHLSDAFFFFFLIKQLVVNSKIGDSAAGQSKRIEKKNKTETCLFSLSTQLTTTTVLQFNTIFSSFCFPALSAQKTRSFICFFTVIYI